MTETMNFGLVVKDKATAMQYAISQARVYNEEKRCYELDLELAKSIFKLFCDNVELPDVAYCGCCGECPTITQNTADELDKALEKFQKSITEIAKTQVAEEKLKECVSELNVREQIGAVENSAKTYDDVAEELFGKEKESWCIIGDAIPFVQTNALFDIPDKAVRCTSHKQTQKVIAINCLLNVAKYLNGDWKPKFYDRNEKKWYIFIDEDGEFDTAFAKEWVTTSVYFKSRELAEKAIEILSGYELGLALSTDY